MRTVVAATLILPLTLLAVVALVNAVNFDNLPVGTAPVGWTATRTGTGEAKWTVEKDDTAPSKPNVLKQSGQATYSNPWPARRGHPLDLPDRKSA